MALFLLKLIMYTLTISALEGVINNTLRFYYLKTIWNTRFRCVWLEIALGTLDKWLAQKGVLAFELCYNPPDFTASTRREVVFLRSDYFFKLAL